MQSVCPSALCSPLSLGLCQEAAVPHPSPQALLIVLFEWVMTCEVTKGENNKAPSEEYSGGSGLLRVMFLHFSGALMSDHMEVYLYTAMMTSSIRMCPWPGGGKSSISTADKSPVSFQVCYCDGRDQECLIHIEAITQPPEKGT